MADIVNLRNVRKARARDKAAITGAENRVRFGEPSHLKVARKSAEKLRDARLDGALLDTASDGRAKSR